MIGGAGGSGDPFRPGGSKGFFEEGTDKVMGKELTAAESKKAQRIGSIVHLPRFGFVRLTQLSRRKDHESLAEQGLHIVAENSMESFRPKPVYGTFEVNDAHATYYTSRNQGHHMFEMNWAVLDPIEQDAPEQYLEIVEPAPQLPFPHNDDDRDPIITETPADVVPPGQQFGWIRPRPGRNGMRDEPPAKPLGCHMQ